MSTLTAIGAPAWKHFPRYMIAVMLLVLAVNVRFITIAVATFPGAASNDDFDTSNRYNAVMDAAAAQAALGWRIRAVTSGATPTVELSDPAGAALSGAIVQATAERPLGPPRATMLLFAEAAAGKYVATTALPAAGQWDLSLRIEQGARRMRITRRVIVP